MTGKTHTKGGHVFALIALNYFITTFLTECNLFFKALLVVIFIACAHFGSLLPDIDQKKSSISKQLPWLANTFGAKCRHRGFTHSLLCLSALAIILGLATILMDFNIIIVSISLGFIVGYISHLALDLLTEDGLEIFYPCKTNFKIGFINTGSKVEKFFNKSLDFLTYLLIALNILLLLGFTR